MLAPAAASISLSASTKARPKRCASRRPMLVLPTPISPTSAIVRGTCNGSETLMAGPCRTVAASLKRSWRADRLSQISHEGTLAYRVDGSSTGRQHRQSAENLAETTGKMGKFVLIGAAVLAVIIVGGLTFLAA